jgi:hypothetical protein
MRLESHCRYETTIGVFNSTAISDKNNGVKEFTSSYLIFLASVKAVGSSDHSMQDVKVQTALVQTLCFRYGIPK